MERNFAAVMSELRHARGLSQRKVAADLKISQALLSHYENGAREPGLAFVCRACDYYGVSADFLLGRAPSPTCTPEQLEALRVLVQDVRTAADRADAGEVVLADGHVAAESQPARLLHSLNEDQLGGHALGHGLVVDDGGEVTDRRRTAGA